MEFLLIQTFSKLKLAQKSTRRWIMTDPLLIYWFIDLQSYQIWEQRFHINIFSAFLRLEFLNFFIYFLGNKPSNIARRTPLVSYCFLIQGSLTLLVPIYSRGLKNLQLACNSIASLYRLREKTFKIRIFKGRKWKPKEPLI